MASLVSLRKRVRRVTLGSFTGWRAVHACVGLLTLGAVGVHTGGRPGSNLNFALLVSFLALNTLGALSGSVTALESKLGPRGARALRSACVTAHILAVWPLPVLVTFHVLAAYYY